MVKITWLASLLIVGLLGSPAQAATPILSLITHVGTLWTVTPSGFPPPQDGTDIQYAINNAVPGETVLLKATANGVPTDFVFANVITPITNKSGAPPNHSIVVTKTLTLTGETTPDGRMSRIVGGAQTVIVSATPTSDVTITNLEIHNFNHDAIGIYRVRNATISNNRVTADTMYQRCYWNPIAGEPGEFMGWGIFAYGGPNAPGLPPFFITGDLVVENNFIDFEQDGSMLTNPVWAQKPNAPYRVFNDMDQNLIHTWEGWNRWSTWGIYLIYTNAPNIVVTGNTVNNYTDKGVYLPGNPGITVVDSNVMNCGFSSFLWGTDDGTLGIAAGTVNGGAFVPAAAIDITNNSITCKAVHGKGYDSNLGTGIWLYGALTAQAAQWLVQGNQITLTEGQVGVHLETVGAYVGQNQLFGDGQTAFNTLATSLNDGETYSGNAFVGNESGAYKAAQYDVLFGNQTADNLFLGHSGKCLDLGMGDQITGCSTNMKGGAGELLQANPSFTMGPTPSPADVGDLSGGDGGDQ